MHLNQFIKLFGNILLSVVGFKSLLILGVSAGHLAYYVRTGIRSYSTGYIA